MIKASELFVQCLEREGVTTIFGVPGEETLDLIDAIRTSSIELIVTRNEQTAAFMAATRGRLTGKPGIALSTLGPGATNLMTGVAHAQLGGMPLIVITGQKPIKNSKQGRFQVLNVVEMMTPITKWATSLVDMHRIPQTLRQAFKLAQHERPGAVHIELPEDIAQETSNDSFAPIPNGKVRRPQIDEKMRNKLVEKIKQAKQPIILIGAGANRKRITNYLTKFITKTNIPFFTSQMGKGVVDETLPQCLGTAATTEGDYIHDVIELSDCIITVGFDLLEKPTNIIHKDNVELIHINFTPAEVDQLYMPTLEVIGDIGNTFWQLTEQDQLDASQWDFEALYARNKENQQKISHTTKLESKQELLGPRRLAKELRELLEPDDILALDNGLYKVRLARNYPAKQPNTIILDNALATMGAGLSSAMVAKILNPDKHVVAVVGDGGLLMNLGDLETAVRLGLDMTIVVLNDHAYGMIKQKQNQLGFDSFGLDLENPDFHQLAKAFGAHALDVKNADRLPEALTKARQQTGVTLIDTTIVYPQTIS